MNEEIVEQIQKNITAAEQVQEGHKTTTLLVFSICKKKYAIKSSSVSEIIKDITIYRLPFVPQYVEGVINRRGDPYTVINPLIIIEPTAEKKIENLLFLVLNIEDDQLCLHISDILYFKDITDSDINSIPNSEEENFFIGTFNFNKEEIPILNPDSFESLIRKELGSA